MSPQQFISEYADSLAEWTINRVGAESIRTIFVGGSLAIDEVSAFDDDGFWEIYSDVDLYVVVQDGVDPVDIRARLSNPPTGDRESCRFLCPADVGVYSVEDLLQQPARPGTVFLGKHHKLLYGDSGVVAEAARAIGRKIQPPESLYLLENRLSELGALPEAADATERRFRRYFVEKIALDIGSAFLIVHHRYAGRRDARIERVRGFAADGDIPANVLEIVEHAGRAYAGLERFLADDESGESRERAVVRASTQTWRALAARILGGDEAGWESLVRRRCHHGEYLHNLREYVAMRRRQGRSKVGSVFPGIRMARMAPVDALRLSALVDYARRLDPSVTGPPALRDYDLFLERLTRTCGFDSGSLAERSADMFADIQ